MTAPSSGDSVSLRSGWDIDSQGNQKVPRLSGVCASETMNHKLCGGWFCICDCHDETEIGPSFSWSDHIDHEWKQVGSCVYCCGHRLYNGSAPANREEREGLARWWDAFNRQTEAQWAEARRRVAAYKEAHDA